MHPLLLELGPVHIHTYGLMMVIGVIVGLFFVRRKAIALGIDSSKLVDIVFWSFVVGLLGGHLLHILTTIQDYIAHPKMLLRFWEGGLVFYGGLITGIGFLIFSVWKNKMGIWRVLDLVAPSIAIGHMFGRFGCFAAGCCHGSQCDSTVPFAVTFTDPSSAAPLNIPLYPAQLYDALNCFIIFLILQFLYPRRKFEGQIISIYIMLYAIGRFIVEIYRGDEIRGFIFGRALSTSQFIAIISFAIAAIFYIYKRRLHSKKT